uniref:CBCO1 protein n=1 Tax=Strix occidentalis caurina TaxID=311401 RepID=A0A8D0L0J5_STROC
MCSDHKHSYIEIAVAKFQEDIYTYIKYNNKFLDFKQLKTSLKEAILLDYYTAGFWWAKEMKFSLIQLSGFMDLLNFLLENLNKRMTLVDNLKELGRALAGIGETDSERSGDLNFFSIEQAKAVIDYLNISLFKHYKLYEYLFHSHGEELVITTSCQHYCITNVKWLIKEYKLDVLILIFKINFGFQKSLNALLG